MATVIQKNRFPEIIASLPPKVDEAAEAAAELISEQAQVNVPVDTGKLQAAIHVERLGQGRYSVTAGDAEAFYGHIVEHGGVSSGARPFLVPAFEGRRDDAVALVEVVLREI